MGKNVVKKYANASYFWYLIVICTGFALYALSISRYFGFQNVDDAYISFRYGWNLMRGNGLVYNTGEYVEGYTNFLWTVLTAPFTLIEQVDIPVFTIFTGILFSIGIIFLLAAIIIKFGKDIPIWLALLPAILLAYDSSFVFWAVSGMETTLFTFLITAVFYFYTKINEGIKYTKYIIIFLILSALCRPEGNMLFVFIAGNIFLFRHSITGYKDKLIKIIIWYTVFFIFYYSFKYFYYGSILPNTFYAKAVTDTAHNYASGLDYLRVSFKARYLIMIFLILIPYRQIIKDYRFNFLVTFTLGYISYIIYAGGDWPGASRFILPVLPFIYILCVLGMVNILNIIKKSKSKVISKSATFIIPVLFLFAAINAYNTFKKLEPYTFLDAIYITYEHECKNLGIGMKELNDSSLKIALAPAGKIAYYSELYCIDMWGLNDKHIANVNSKSETTAHRKFDFNYILSKKPDFIIGYAGFTRDNVPEQYNLIRESTPENGFLPVFKLNK